MFRHVLIRTRLGVGFIIVLGLLVALTVISISRISAVNANLAMVNDVNSVKQRYAINFRGSVHNRAIAVRDIVLLHTPAERQETLDHIRALEAEYKASAGPLDTMLQPGKQPKEEELRILASIKATEAKTLPLVEEVIRRRNAGDETGAWSVLMLQARPMFEQWLAQINQFIDFEEAANKSIGGTTRQATESFSSLLMIVCGGAIVIGGFIAWWSINSVRPIRAMAEIMERLEDSDGEIPCTGDRNELGQLAAAMHAFREKLKQARAESQRAEQSKEQQVDLIMSSVGEGLLSLSKGDLTARVNVELEGRYARLKPAFNDAMERLGELIGAVANRAAAIRTGSTEIAQASEDLARRTESNAASLEETAASITQMDGRLKASATAASRTVERADQAIATVGEGARLPMRQFRRWGACRKARRNRSGYRRARQDRVPDPGSRDECGGRSRAGR